MSKSRRTGSAPNPEWATIHSRVAWLVRTRFKNSRSALAKAIGFSHTIVAEVAKDRVPGPRLIDAIVTRLHVDRAWLEHGEGSPFARHDEALTGRGIPMTNVLLPGPPSAHREMITGGWVTVPEIVASPSVYWLALQSTQPVVKKSSSEFRTGDHLLMETDPAKFPKEDRLWGEVCVVRDGAGGSQLKLAAIEYRSASEDTGDPRLEADYFDAADPDQTVVEDVYRRFPDGLVQHFQRRLKQEGRRSAMRVMDPLLPVIRYTDIVSVWLKILRRPLG
jgi:hypothetical protein